jgi:hypothetical protein
MQAAMSDMKIRQRKPYPQTPALPSSSPDSDPSSAGRAAGNWRDWLTEHKLRHGDEVILERFETPLIDPDGIDGEEMHSAGLFITRLTPDQQKVATNMAALMQSRNLLLKECRQKGDMKAWAHPPDVQADIDKAHVILVKVLDGRRLTQEEARHCVATQFPPSRRDVREVLLQLTLRVAIAIGGCLGGAHLSHLHFDAGSPVCDPVLFTAVAVLVSASLAYYVATRPWA